MKIKETNLGGSKLQKEFINNHTGGFKNVLIQKLMKNKFT